MSDLKIVPIRATMWSACMGCDETVPAVVSIEVDFYFSGNHTYCATCAQRILQELKALLLKDAHASIPQ